MRKLLFLCGITLLSFTVGCSDDDSDVLNSNLANYYPLENNNSWTYTNRLNIEQQENQEGTETLTAVDAGNNAYTFEREGDILTGFASSILTNGEVTKQNNSLLYNGALTIDLSEFGSFPINLEPIVFSIENAKLYDKAASAGTNLFSNSNQITQELSFEGQSFDLVIDYDIFIDQGQKLDNYSVATESFADVITSKIGLRMSISAIVGGFISLPLLDETEVISSTNYFAKDIGLIYNETQYDIATEAISEINIPSLEYHAVLSQAIDSYSFN